MGINVRRIQAGSFAAACALAGVAGFMVVPLTLAEPQMGTVLGLKAFAIAIIAGLAAPRGILLCGLGYGALLPPGLTELVLTLPPASTQP
jgi:branched-chain amino acid transport system permease protein